MNELYYMVLLFLCSPLAADGAAGPVMREDPAGATVLVPAGEFVFGSDAGEIDKRPRQSRSLPAFFATSAGSHFDPPESLRR